MNEFFYPFIGFIVAAFGTLIGAGGGIIFVPLFLFFFDLPPTIIIGTSLTIVFLNAISGTIAYIRQKKVRYDAAIQFSLATLPGAVIGALWSDHFSGTSFQMTFGAVLSLIALLIFWKNRTRKPQEESGTDFHYSVPKGIAISFLVGFISSILGIGGGVIHVPAMIYLLHFPAHVATATSHFVLAISAGIGVATHAWAHHIHLHLALLFGSGALLGAQFGAYLAKKVNAQQITLLLSIALFLLGLRLLLTAS